MNINWTSADGDSLDFINSGSSSYLWDNISGITTPEQDIVSQQAPFQHGQTSLRTQLRPRSIKFDVHVIGTTGNDMISKRESLGRVLSGLSKTNGVNRGVLTFTLNDGSIRYISATAGGLQESRRLPRFQSFNVYFQCDDPFFYGEEESASLTEGADIDISNDGEFPVFPVIKIVGPSNAPRITNNTSGKYIEVTYNLASGHRLEFDHRFGQKTINDVVIATSEPTSVFAYITDLAEFFDLSVGTNSLTFDSSDDAGTCTIYWTPKYFAIG